jgi:hypothetical protein
LRIEYPGAAHHVMARGNQGRAIFKDDPDRRRFLETLAGAREKTGWRIHAYVLMRNHYHLLVETPENCHFSRTDPFTDPFTGVSPGPPTAGQSSLRTREPMRSVSLIFPRFWRSCKSYRWH